MWYRTPASFDGGEVLLALTFSASPFHQAVLAPDATERAMAERDKLTDQTASTENGQGLTECEDLVFGK
jgi:hypothetical protein